MQRRRSPRKPELEFEDWVDYCFNHNVACQESALHGLGHLAHYHPVRVPAIIDAFLARNRDAPAELRAYASYARSGRVQ